MKHKLISTRKKCIPTCAAKTLSLSNHYKKGWFKSFILYICITYK